MNSLDQIDVLLPSLFEIIGAPLAWIMKNAFYFLHLHRFPETISLALLVWMAWCIALCWWKIRLVRGRLHTCWNSLRSHKDIAQNFAGLQDVDRLVGEGKDALFDCWSRFRMTVVERTNQQGYLTVLPEVFFNIHRLGLEAPLRRLGKWSGLFVGIGLLVTFLGLVAALDSAASAIKAATAGGENSTETMQNALKGLLSAATFKFYTSIFGLFASLIISYTEKFFRRNLEKMTTGICRELERLLPLLSPESLLVEQGDVARQTTDQLKQFNTAMAEGLMKLSVDMVTALERSIKPVQQELNMGFQNTASTVSASMNKALQENSALVCQGLEQVGSSMGAMEETFSRTIGEHLSSMQEKTLGTLADKLGGVVNQQAGSELQNLAATLENLNNSLSGMASSLNQGGVSFAETLDSAVKELHTGVVGLSHVAENISKSVNHDMAQAQQILQERLASLGDELSSRGQAAAVQLTDATTTVLGAMQKSFVSVDTQMERLSAALSQASQSLVVHHQAMQKATGQTQSIADSMGKISGSIDKSMLPMTNSIRSMDSSLDKLLKGANAVGTATQQAETDIQKISESLKTTSYSLEQNWQKHLGRFEDLDNELSHVLQQIMQALSSNTAKVSEYVEKIDQHLGSAVSQLADGIEDLDEVMTKHLSGQRP